MEGQLSTHSFAELISEIKEKQLSGALRIERERVKAVVYFDAGELIYASSNLRNLRLIEYLKKRNIPVDGFASLDSSSDFTVAASLSARGVITKSTLDDVITEQVMDVARVLSLWPSGTWTFDERARLTEPVRAQCNMAQLLLDAARRVDRGYATSRYSDPTELISRGSNPAIGLNLTATEGFLLSRVETPIEFEQLVNLSGMREPDARRIIYGLVLAGVLNRESGSQALKGGLRRKKTEAKEAKPNVEPAAPVAQDPQVEVNEFLEQIARAANHYEVLNIAQTAEAKDVKLAYYALARRFHPDRYHDLINTDLHTRLESAFARITQAHEMLSNADTKATYDVKIAALKNAGRFSSMNSESVQQTSTSQTSANGVGNAQVAEQRFQEGVAALQLGESNTATAALSAAARLAPNNARYRAYYGRALASHPQTKRMAEAELQAAVKLEPANASYRVMLATLYRDLGFWRRAINELERALSLDSKNAEARRMLHSLETRK